MYQLTREQKISNLQETLTAIDTKIENLQKQKSGVEKKIHKLKQASESKSSTTESVEGAFSQAISRSSDF